MGRAETKLAAITRMQAKWPQVLALGGCVLGSGVCMTSTACYGRGAGLFAAVATTAIVTAVVVSASQPPPPRVVIVPEPRTGYVWDPGHWTLTNGAWVWVDGSWVAVQPGYTWLPTHWVQRPDGSWELVPGHWAASAPPAPPPPPPPG